ncbi:hypothetical protein [Streptomyces smyrnaeus]|uniref:hypothetical protein n=1 Tax=Streptomyces smyrnaeus TaxID=1387713 RepID=UPI0033F7B315
MTRFGSRVRELALCVAVAGLLSGCGGGDDADGEETKRKSGSDSRSSAEDTAPEGKQKESAPPGRPATQLEAAPVYDTGAGWERRWHGDPLVLPRTDAVAEFSGQDAPQGRFTVVDAATGKVRWISRSLSSVAPADDSEMDSAVLTTGGKDYLAAWSSGRTGEDVVRRGEQVLTVDLFDADASGDSVPPAHHVEIKNPRRVWHGTGALMVELKDEVVAIDPATGKKTTYDPEELKPPRGCADCSPGGSVEAITTAGPVARTYINDYDGFWVPGKWASADIAPSGAVPEGARTQPVSDELLIAQWERKGNKEETVWAVVNAADGKVRASAQCGRYGWQAAKKTTPRLSANGRFVSYGTAVFDVEKGDGHCFPDTDKSKEVMFDQVTDKGEAFGYTKAAGQGLSTERTPVLIDITSGKAKPLAEGTAVPEADLAGMGLFLVEREDRLVAYRHAD